jgi:hypothetical protein
VLFLLFIAVRKFNFFTVVANFVLTLLASCEILTAYILSFVFHKKMQLNQLIFIFLAILLHGSEISLTNFQMKDLHLLTQSQLCFYFQSHHNMFIFTSLCPLQARVKNHFLFAPKRFESSLVLCSFCLGFLLCSDSSFRCGTWKPWSAITSCSCCLRLNFWIF